MNTVLWIVQALLAALFLFAGVMKLMVPTQELAQQAQMSGLFLKFIAVCEVLGALGLILPGVLKIQPGLTPPRRGRTGDHHDRRHRGNGHDRGDSDGALSVCGRYPRGVCRLRPVAPDALIKGA